jgi:glycosyltransferase involved in cell wall biosynthesis
MKISIITPNYNYSKYVEETINSVIDQPYDDIEHIIVDDGSSDNSIEIVNKYLKLHPHNIRLFVQPHKGQTSAINLGLIKASGDIIGWINSDDYYCKDVFPKIVKLFEINPSIDIIFGNVNIVDLQGNHIYKLRHINFNYGRSVFLGFANMITSNAIFWRKSLSDKIGFLNEELKCNMDGEYFSRLTLNARIKRTSITIANHRKNITQASLIDENWNRTITKEIKIEFDNSYVNLINFKLCIIKDPNFLKKYYLLEHRIVRFLLFYTIFQKIEKIKYFLMKKING